MWDILLHNSPRTSSAPSGEGLFDLSFFRAPEDGGDDKETVETEIFHNSSRAVDTLDGGQALPPYSSAADGRPSSKDEDLVGQGIWDRPHSATVDSSGEQYPPLSETLWPGPGLRGDGSLMDLTHDPFFQFQDHQSPYMGIWEIGNL